MPIVVTFVCEACGFSKAAEVEKRGETLLPDARHSSFAEVEGPSGPALACFRCFMHGVKFKTAGVTYEREDPRVKRVSTFAVPTFAPKRPRIVEIVEVEHDEFDDEELEDQFDEDLAQEVNARAISELAVELADFLPSNPIDQMAQHFGIDFRNQDLDDPLA